MGHAELHFHLLPGVDDGPRTLEQSLELAAAAVADGTELVVATPHIRPDIVDDPLIVADHVAELVSALGRERIPLAVRPGGEVDHAIIGSLSDRQLDAIAHGPAGARWLLVESPFKGRGPDFTAACDELRGRGFSVLVGHPERSAPGAASEAALAHELAAGSALQVNAWSVTGAYADDVCARARMLLRRDPDALIASDAHGRDRLPSLTDAVGVLADAGEHDPLRRVDHNPWALLRRGIPRPAHARRAA